MNQPDARTDLRTSSWHGVRLGTLMLLMVPVAAFLGLYTRDLRQRLGHSFHSIKPFIPLDIQVVDDANGEPIRGARIYYPMLNPDWRGRPEMADGDLSQTINSEIASQPFATTGKDGVASPRTGTMGQHERRLEYRLLGLWPVAGKPEIRLLAVAGIRVAADGYVTSTAFLEDIASSSGRPLARGVPLPVKIRLKRSPPSD